MRIRIGIDASNLRLGGGVTHLRELLRAAAPERLGIARVVVWGGARTLAEMPARPWLELAHEPVLDGPLWMRQRWQSFRLAELARASCDALFVPGGAYWGRFWPFVTMSRNLLPFEKPERDRYGCSWMRAKMLVLRGLQAATFRKASGLVFLSKYARAVVARTVGLDGRQPIIPHGVSEALRLAPRRQQALGAYSPSRPFRLLYVSNVDVYKHQWHVVDAVGRLRRQGIPISLDLIGPAYPPALARLEHAMRAADPEGAFIRYTGSVPAAELPAHYHRADGLVFASSCENMPNTLLEGMAAGLPIVCARRGPMPEILGGAGTYFEDPERPEQIAGALNGWLHEHEAREQQAWAAYHRAAQYSWERCASETFSYLTEVAGTA